MKVFFDKIEHKLRILKCFLYDLRANYSTQDYSKMATGQIENISIQAWHLDNTYLVDIVKFNLFEANLCLYGQVQRLMVPGPHFLVN